MKLLASDEGIIIEWEEPLQDGILSYKLYRYQRGGKPVAMAALNSGTTKYTDKTAKRGQLYFYYLTTVLKNGNESNPGREEGVWR
jgi:fibronectin type 3 domain-containing protein